MCMVCSIRTKKRRKCKWSWLMKKTARVALISVPWTQYVRKLTHNAILYQVLDAYGLQHSDQQKTSDISVMMTATVHTWNSKGCANIRRLNKHACELADNYTGCPVLGRIWPTENNMLSSNLAVASRQGLWLSRPNTYTHTWLTFKKYSIYTYPHLMEPRMHFSYTWNIFKSVQKNSQYCHI